MLEKLYWWPAHRDQAIRKCYKSVSSKRLRDIVNDQKALATLNSVLHKEWLEEEFWEEMKKKMDTPAYKAKCEKAKVACAKGGHRTGGSIPISEYYRRPETYETLESRVGKGGTAKGSGTSQLPTPAVRNGLLIQVVGRGKGGRVYGTGSLASHPSIYSRAPLSPPPPPPQTKDTADAYILRQITQILVGLQGQVSQMSEVLSTAGLIHTATAPAPASTSASPATTAPPTIAPLVVSPTPSDVPVQDVQRFITLVLGQLYACGRPAMPPPPPPPSV